MGFLYTEVGVSDFTSGLIGLSLELGTGLEFRV